MKKKRKKANPTIAMLNDAGQSGIVSAVKDGKEIDISEIKVGWYDFEMKDGELHITFSKDQTPKP